MLDHFETKISYQHKCQLFMEIPMHRISEKFLLHALFFMDTFFLWENSSIVNICIKWS